MTSIDDLPGAAEMALPRTKEPEAMALIQYTSGSTGAPKGVVLSHANILANVRALGSALEVSGADTFVSWLPVYHDLGLIGAWLGSLYYGAPLVLMPPQRFLLRPERWLWAIHRHRGTLSAAPNFAFDLCVRGIDDRGDRGPRTCHHCGSWRTGRSRSARQRFDVFSIGLGVMDFAPRRWRRPTVLPRAPWR